MRHPLWNCTILCKIRVKNANISDYFATICESISHYSPAVIESRGLIEKMLLITPSSVCIKEMNISLIEI